VLNGAAWLITQRSQVKILPPLPGSAGQRPDRQDGGQAFACGVRGLGTGRVPGPVAQQRPSEARTLDLRVLTAAEVASVLRVDIDTIIGAISNGDLPGNRIGNQWRVDYEALVRWLQCTYGKPTI
jgi:excisionase family DNA binding protein